MSTHKARCKRFGIPVLTPALVLMMMLGAGCSEKETTSTQEAAPAPAPAAQTAEPEAPPPAETAPPAAEPEAAQAAAGSQAGDESAASVDGQKIYQTACQACHAAGVAGAPKLGDKEAWAPRIAKGEDVLFASVNNGLNAMPPKGACMSCSEDELRAAVEYMVEQGS